MQRFFLILNVFCLLFITGCTTSSQQTPKPVVLVTVPPYVDLVQRLAGDHVAVEIFVPPGADPHTYEPSPEQINRFSQAKIWFRTGDPMEEKMVEFLSKKDVRIINLSTSSTFLTKSGHGGSHGGHHNGHGRKESHSHGDRGHHHRDEGHNHGQSRKFHDGRDHDHERRFHDGFYDNDFYDEDFCYEQRRRGYPETDECRRGGDFHIWLNPLYLSEQAEVMSITLADCFPEIAPLVQERSSTLIDDLKKADLDIAQKLEPFRQSYLLVSHPALGFFCKRYDLHQLSVEVHGKDPLPQDVASLMNQIEKYYIPVVLTFPQYNNKGALLIADKLQLPIEEINPYSEEYFGMLDRLTQVIIKHYENKATLENRDHSN